MALGLGVGAEDAEAPVGEGAAAGPCLLAVEDPVAVVRRVAGGAGADAGEVAAGVGLGPALAPDLVAARHRREVARLLGVRPVLEHGGGEQEDAVLAHPLRGPGAVVLLLEHEPLEDADVAPAVFDGPAHHRPAVLVHGALPGAVGLEACGRIEGGEGVGGDVRFQPRPRLGPEGLLLGVEGQVHDGGESSTAIPPVPRRRSRRAALRRPRRQPTGTGALCSMTVRTKKSTTACYHLRFGGHLAHRVEFVPAVVHGQELAWHAGHTEIPGQLLRLLRIDDLVVVRVEDEEGRVTLVHVRRRAGPLQVGAQLLVRHVAEQRDEALGDQHGVALVPHGEQVARPRHVDHRLHAARLVAVGADVPPSRWSGRAEECHEVTARTLPPGPDGLRIDVEAARVGA